MRNPHDQGAQAASGFSPEVIEAFLKALGIDDPKKRAEGWDRVDRLALAEWRSPDGKPFVHWRFMPAAATLGAAVGVASAMAPLLNTQSK